MGFAEDRSGSAKSRPSALQCARPEPANTVPETTITVTNVTMNHSPPFNPNTGIE